MATAMVVRRLGHGWGFSKLVGVVQHVVRMNLQTARVTRRMVRNALQALAPKTFAARAFEPFQRRLRGTLILPHRDLWWQLDLDCKLQDYGLYVAGIVDAFCRTILALVVLPDKTAVTIFNRCLALALQRVGHFPEMLTTDAAKELMLLAFACRLARAHSPSPQGTWRMPPHRAMPSTRHIRIERLWGEVNPKVLFMPKTMLIRMESMGILDMNNSLHACAIQLLLSPLLQFGADDFTAIHNSSKVRSTKGHGGVPLELRRAQPHPHEALLPPFNPAANVIASYERAAGELLPRPIWLDARDPLRSQPHRQAARVHAIMQVWGSVEAAWVDVLHAAGAHLFIPSFLLFVQFR